MDFPWLWRRKFDPFQRLFTECRAACRRRFNTGELGRGSDLRPRLPRSLHHIWIGDTIPDPYNRCAEENRQFCLENKIEYRLWGNQDLEDAQACDERLRTILNSVPAGDWACRKDVFALWILLQRGGVVADCSILVKPEFVKAFDHVEHLFFYPDDSPDIRRLPHAIPCPITFVGAPARSPLIEGIYDGFARFWQSDYLRMNKLYTHPVRFGDRTVPHGWMAQLYINECLMDYLLARSPGKNPDDIFLSHTEFMHDIDFVPAAYLFKYLYLELLPKSEFLRLAAPYNASHSHSSRRCEWSRLVRWRG